MDGLRGEITNLQAAVRYLREDNQRARTTEQHKYAWLAEPLKKPPSVEQRRRAVVAAEGRDVLGEILRIASSAKVYDLTTLPEDKLAWRRAKTTPQYHAAKQAEDYAAWKSWQEEVVKKSRTVLGGKHAAKAGNRALARLQIRLPGGDGKVIPGTGKDVQIVGSAEWERLRAARVETD
jgi:dynactin 1